MERWLAITRCCVVVVLCVTRSAIADQAEPAVLLVETKGAPELPTLAAQVELQINARPIETRVEREQDPWTYSRRAHEMVAWGTAKIIVWIAPVDGGYVVFASTTAPGRALIELVRVDATLSPAELERTIALKIAGLYDAVRALPPLKLGRDIPDEAVTAWWIEVGGGLAFERHDRRFDGRSGIAVGRAWTRDAWSFSPVVAAHWQPSGVAVATSGRASLTELGTSIGVEGARVMSRIELFARPRFLVATLHARGDSNDGRHGTATLYSAYGGLDLGARFALSRSAWVGVSVGGDAAFVRHRLTVDDETVIDLGRFRVEVGAVLRVAL